MKKLFLLLLIASSFLSSQAQRAIVMPLAAGDTIVNTGTSSKVFTMTGGYAGVAVQVNLTRISGTGAGTVQIFGSLDGTNYTQIGANYTITNVASQSTVFYVSAPVPVYLKVLATGAGTESVVQQVLYVLRKYQSVTPQ